MARTISALRTRVYTLIGEDSSTDLDTQILEWLNQCRDELQPIARVEDTWDVAVLADAETADVSNTTTYNWWTVDYAERRKTTDTDLPSKYGRVDLIPSFRRDKTGLWIWNGTMYVPKSSTAYTYRLFGYTRLDEFTAAAVATQTPQTDQSFDDLYVLFAVQLFGAQDEDFLSDGRWANFAGKYERRRREFETAMLARQPAWAYAVKR